MDSMDNIYTREKKFGRGDVYEVKIGGKRYGTFESVDEAKAVRNAKLIELGKTTKTR